MLELEDLTTEKKEGDDCRIGIETVSSSKHKFKNPKIQIQKTEAVKGMR